MQHGRAEEGEYDDGVARCWAALPEAQAGCQNAGMRGERFSHEMVPKVPAEPGEQGMEWVMSFMI